MITNGSAELASPSQTKVPTRPKPATIVCPFCVSICLIMRCCPRYFWNSPSVSREMNPPSVKATENSPMAMISIVCKRSGVDTSGWTSVRPTAEIVMNTW